MAKQQYVSPKMEVNVLSDEDIITGSVFTTTEIDGEKTTVVAGNFSTGWLA